MATPKTNLPAIIPLPLMDPSLFDDQSFDLEDGAAGLMERMNPKSCFLVVVNFEIGFWNQFIDACNNVSLLLSSLLSS
jgi:hypothetical protein